MTIKQTNVKLSATDQRVTQLQGALTGKEGELRTTAKKIVQLQGVVETKDREIRLSNQKMTELESTVASKDVNVTKLQRTISKYVRKCYLCPTRYLCPTSNCGHPCYNRSLFI